MSSISSLKGPVVSPFRSPTVRRLFVTRIVRLFAYGFVALILWLYLAALGWTPERIGLLLTMTLLGDVVVSLWITTTADRLGRRRMLVAGAVLMALAGAVFLTADDFYLLLAAATIGVISPSGNEVGPFLAIEQAALAQVVTAEQRTRVFAWYSLAGALAGAFGFLFCGLTVQALRDYAGFTPLQSYRAVLWVYAGVGVLLAVLFTRLSSTAEAHAAAPAEKPPPRPARSPWPDAENRDASLTGQPMKDHGLPVRSLTEASNPPLALEKVPPAFLGLHRSHIRRRFPCRCAA